MGTARDGNVEQEDFIELGEEVCGDHGLEFVPLLFERGARFEIELGPSNEAVADGGEGFGHQADGDTDSVYVEVVDGGLVFLLGGRAPCVARDRPAPCIRRTRRRFRAGGWIAGKGRC